MFRTAFREVPAGFRKPGPRIIVTRPPPPAVNMLEPEETADEERDDTTLTGTSVDGACEHRPWRALAPEGTVWGDDSCPACEEDGAADSEAVIIDGDLVTSTISRPIPKKVRPRPGDRLRAIARRL